MKCDQCAWYAKDDDAATCLIKSFGLEDKKWVNDLVTGKSLFPDGSWSVNVGKLRFNYDLGIELEVLTYTEGRHWHQSDSMWNNYAPSIFISHIGYHLDDGEEFPEVNWPLVQETFTISHTAEYLTTGPAAGRKYHYRIHQVSTGSYVKYIRRIHPGKQA
jgi:hypothetical protein